MTNTINTGIAAARHDDMVAAYDAQQARLVPSEGDAWAGLAQFFKLDPRRPLDPLLERIAAFIQPDDRLIDVGGGAGRLALPLSFRCNDVVIIDPSAGMGQAFESAIYGTGIENARFLHKDWMDASGIEGDVALVAHVTYFVPHVAPFVEKLNAATKRRVIVSVRSVPPPNQMAPVFRLVHSEEMSLVPGPVELRAVLDELGIAHELVDVGPAAAPATTPASESREQTVQTEVENAVRAAGLKPGNKARFSKLLEEHFGELFVKTERGYWRRNAVDARDLLITWEVK